jgi:hypothetical protein
MSFARDPFADLIDDFDGGEPVPNPSPAPAASPAPDDDSFTPPAERAAFRETCKKCNGRGRFIGYGGRDFGQCFACKGVGHFNRMTSPAERQRKRDGGVRRKASQKQERRDTFAAAHPAEWAWMLARTGRATFAFPTEMIEKIEHWGDLTEGQLNAVQRLMARDAEREQAAKAVVEAAPVVVEIDRLMTAFDAAIAKGVKAPKMRFDGFVASLAPASGKNPGAVYLKAGDLYLGKIAGGKLVASGEASPAQQAAVLEAMADPRAAAVAYGRRTGACSCCGRELTNALSIELGIGPICRDMFGL